MSEEQTSKLAISKKDLEDPDLYRLNSILNFIQQQIGSTINDSRLRGTTSTEKITTKLYDSIPGPNDVVPWGTIKKFLSPASIRQAWVTNNWLGTPVRPIAGIDVPANQAGFIQAFINTHALRLSAYPAGSYEVGSLFYETDRNSLYQVQVVGGTNVWVWISGLMIDSLANQPSDLGTDDDGFNFLSTDIDAQFSYRWDGTTWQDILLFAKDEGLFKYDDTDYPTLRFGRARGDEYTPTDAASADVITDILFEARRSGVFVTSAGITVDIESTPSGSTAAGRLTVKTVDSTGSALTDRWIFDSDGNFIPATDVVSDIGSATNAVKQVWTQDLNVKQGGALGDVLTNDGADNAVWQSPTAGGGSVKFARSSSTNTLTTSFADITGCSLTLDQDGVWAIIGNFAFYKAINDDECLGQLDFEGTAQTGYARGPGVDVLDDVRAMSSQCWTVTVSAQPNTAKLQAKKNAGTGSSTSDANNTTIMAIFIG